jgi:hypothetical protein
MDAHPVNIYEYEEIAKGKMGQGEYDFIAGAATDEITLRRTRAVFDSILLRPRMMVDISQRDLHTTVLGRRSASRSCSTRRVTTAPPIPKANWPVSGPPAPLAR